jgi:hypothetical protein
MIESAIKVLSGNDVGVTKSHQAGFLVPKSLVKGGLFEQLSDTTLNPRLKLKFIDRTDDSVYYFGFIYYNNRFFGGTRSEYRLTGMSMWIKDNGLRAGDAIEITKVTRFDYSFQILKFGRRPSALVEESWTAIYGKVRNYGTEI